MPAKYLNWGITLSEIPKRNIGSKIKKKIIKYSFLNLVNLFKKKIGVKITNNIIFFSLKYNISILFIMSLIKDSKNKTVSKLVS